MSRFGFVLILLGDPGASWICDLLSFINFGNHLAIILKYALLFFHLFHQLHVYYRHILPVTSWMLCSSSLFFFVFNWSNLCLQVHWFFCIQRAGKHVERILYLWYHILFPIFDSSLIISISPLRLSINSYMFIFLPDSFNTLCVCSVTRSCPFLWNLPGSSVQGIFLRQEYWSGLPFPSPGDLPDPGIKPKSLASPVSRRILYHCTT